MATFLADILPSDEEKNSHCSSSCHRGCQHSARNNFYQRHEDNATPVKKEAPPLNPDYYVNIRKLYPHDLRSAKQLTRQPVWVKVGYFYPFYPYDSAAHHTELSHEAGKLLP